jgi:flagellar protein FliS
MYVNGANAYHSTGVMTADPKRLVIMCYEGAIDSLKLAKKMFIAKDFESKAKAITKAQGIISELMQALDFEKGGEIAKNLDAIYNYISRRIIEADITRDLSGLDEAIRILEELKSAWEEIFYGHTKTETTSTNVNDDSVAQTVSA